uniref:DUF4477 domain-containing protein n=1 Tax=Caenorhabditis tropicalis TaxID=1561998 RepID=A0A1I7TFZ2_9PELO
MESKKDRHTIDFLDTYSNDVPSTFFEREPTLDSTTVREMNLMLRNVVNQLRCPINLDAEALTKWLIYKQSGPHRHQQFFGFFRQMNRCIQKYNYTMLTKKLNNVLRKAENCGNDMYPLETTAVRYIGCVFLKRVFMLERIRDTCVKCAERAIGLLELEHWTNLSLVAVALCSQIYSEVVTHLLGIENAYNSSSKVFRNVDERFPEMLSSLRVVRKIKEECRRCDERPEDKLNLVKFGRLLKFSTKRLMEARAENELRAKTTEILNEILNDELVSSSTNETAKQSKPPVQSIISDLGLSISRKEASFLNSSVQSESPLFEKK